MKKNLRMLVISLFVFTTLSSFFTVFSDEKDNYCENMLFTVQTFKEDSEVIDSNAEPESEIMLEIGSYREATTADDNGEFKFQLEANEFESGTDITLSNNQHVIETEVKEAGSNVQIIESKLDDECVVPEELLEESEEKKVDDVQTEEDPSTSEESEKEEEEKNDAEQLEEEQLDEEKTSNQTEKEQETTEESEISLSSTTVDAMETVTVHGPVEFAAAINNPKIEKIILSNDIKSNETIEIVLTAESDSREKIIEGEGHHIQLRNASITVGTSISRMEIRNASLETLR